MTSPSDTIGVTASALVVGDRIRLRTDPHTVRTVEAIARMPEPGGTRRLYRLTLSADGGEQGDWTANPGDPFDLIYRGPR